MENDAKIAEEQTNKPKKSKLKTILLIIVGIILIGLSYVGGWYVGREFAKYEDEKIEEKNNKKEESSKEDSSKEENAETKEENKLKEISIDSTKVKTAYDIIPHIDGLNIMENAYQSEKTTLDKLSNELILGMALYRTEFNGDNTKPIEGEEEGYDPNSLLGDSWFTFESSVIQNTVKKLYGKEVENGNSEPFSGESIMYENGKYHYSYGGNGFIRTTNVREIVKAYEDENYLYIEDRYAYIYNNFENEENEIYEVYKNSNKKDIISEITKEETLEDIIKNHKDQMQSYKHTFAKNVDGTYYWVSTEPIA